MYCLAELYQVDPVRSASEANSDLYRSLDSFRMLAELDEKLGVAIMDHVFEYVVLVPDGKALVTKQPIKHRARAQHLSQPD